MLSATLILFLVGASLALAVSALIVRRAWRRSHRAWRRSWPQAPIVIWITYNPTPGRVDPWHWQVESRLTGVVRGGMEPTYLRASQKCEAEVLRLLNTG